MTINKVSYAMRSELLYKYINDLSQNWTPPDTKSSLCKRRAQEIDVNEVFDCCFRHTIHPEWNVQSDESKDKLYHALEKMKQVHVSEDNALIGHLMDVCRNPWTSDVVKNVLSGSRSGVTETSNGN